MNETPKHSHSAGLRATDADADHPDADRADPPDAGSAHRADVDVDLETSTPRPDTRSGASGRSDPDADGAHAWPAPEPLTRDRLLRAGREAFARRGYAAASVREITTAADANLGAITYHFGSKQGLYDAVLEMVFGPLRERVQAAARDSAGEPALSRIERVVRTAFGVIRENPDFPYLLIQQMAATHELPGPALQSFPVVFGTVAALIREGQVEGTIRVGNPLLLAISTVSQPAYFGVVGHFLLQRLPPALGPRPGMDEIEEHAVSFLRGALGTGE